MKFTDLTFVKKGTQVLPNVFSAIDGFCQINEQNAELIIKPGELYQLTETQKSTLDKSNRFINAGDYLFSDIVVQKLSYIEFIKVQGIEYLLLRPVKTYRVPQEKGSL